MPKPPAWLRARLQSQLRRLGGSRTLPLPLASALYNPLTGRVERDTIEGQGGRGRRQVSRRSTYRFPWPYIPPESVDKFPGAFYGVCEGKGG